MLLYARRAHIHTRRPLCTQPTDGLVQSPTSTRLRRSRLGMASARTFRKEYRELGSILPREYGSEMNFVAMTPFMRGNVIL